MALDGIFLSKVKDELIEKAVGLRVDKVQQPSRDEIVLNLRGRQGTYRLLICVRADSPRVHFTSHSIENPPVPPMFCMLLRKHLTGALIMNIRQQELDRIIFIDFSASNEIGDRVNLTLCIEIMGKYSNLILVNQDGKVIDSAKRVDLTTSSVRQILPGIEYKLPPKQDKICLENGSITDIISEVMSQKDKYLSSALMSAIQGISPIISREIAYSCCSDDIFVRDITVLQIQALTDMLKKIKNELHAGTLSYMVCTPQGKPKELSFINISQYGGSMLVKEYDSVSALLDEFYFERDRINRISLRGHELIKLLNNLIDRTTRKVNIQREELKKCEHKDDLKLFGELITSNLHILKKGSAFYEVPNYYDNMNIIRIACNPALTPTENANKYYKEYRKAKTAEVMLKKLIVEGENEITYLESVLDELSRADTDSELSAIRQELVLGGYVKNKGGKKQKIPKELPPIEYMSSDGYRILVGRNNVQNDRLSMKTANNNDMWLHTQGFPGSHVIIENQGGEVSDISIEEAAVIAAVCSKAKDSSLVPVDYTKVKFLKKPVGAKPGKVIYHEYYTIITNPDKEFAEKLRVK
ncbi:MAG: NFACT family protein [Faecalibacterium sp.]|nr:NFACT family protein [Ruminococcus sp.]MCM1392344.1 NFACT family protein [Ruminococcus sp.]MCM1484660.1 NFACT family protein [Faecalibacterium sp.]